MVEWVKYESFPERAFAYRWSGWLACIGTGKSNYTGLVRNPFSVSFFGTANRSTGLRRVMVMLG